MTFFIESKTKKNLKKGLFVIVTNFEDFVRRNMWCRDEVPDQFSCPYQIQLPILPLNVIHI